MSNTSLTLFEFHLGDARIQIGPKAIGGTNEDRPESEAIDGEDASVANARSRRCPVRPVAIAVLLLGVVAVVAAVAWKVVGDGDLDDAVALDELND